MSGGFCVRCPMDYQAFTNDSLTMMYEGIRGALASDDALSGLGEEPRFRVRETPEWKKHAADIESEMLKRGMVFEMIDWSENQPKLPATGRPAPPYSAVLLHRRASVASQRQRCRRVASQRAKFLRYLTAC